MEVVMGCRVGAEDVQSTGWEAPKDPAEEEAARRKAFEKAVTHAKAEEKARRNAYAKEVKRAAQEDKDQRKAHEEAMKRVAQEEGARRGVNATTLITLLPTSKKKKKAHASSLKDGWLRDGWCQ